MRTSKTLSPEARPMACVRCWGPTVIERQGRKVLRTCADCNVSYIDVDGTVDQMRRQDENRRAYMQWDGADIFKFLEERDEARVV